MRVCTQCGRLVPKAALACPDDGASVQDVTMLPAGARIGEYKIVRLLGEGGMGYVYEATHEVLRRRTAMKFLRPEYASEPEVVARFMQEAQAVNLVDHENIVNVYDIGDAADGSVYFVMEYLEGRDLSDLQSGGRPLALPLILHIYGQVLRALHAAHAKQLVHRDLKPANVFITKREGNPYFAKLLDFGVAKLRDGTSRAKTREGAVLGTPSYMSPEQIQGKVVDHRSDIFTIGTMLYRAATGVAPFRGDTFGELAAEVIAKDPPLIRTIAAASSLPASLERLIAKAMRKKVAERHQTIAEVLLDLEAVRRDAKLGDAALDDEVAAIAGVPEERVGTDAATRASVGASNPVFQGVPVAAAPAPKRRGLVIAVVVAAVAVGAVGVVLATRGSSPAKPAAAPAPVVITPDAAPAKAAAPDRLAELSAGLDGDAASQTRVVAALALVGSPRSAPLLYRALDLGPDVRVRAARALRELKLPEAAAKLRAALDGSGDKLRVELAAAMAVLGDADADAILLDALADEATGLTAAAALVEAGRGARARKLLDDVFAGTPAGRDRWRVAAEALARLDDKRAREALTAELAQPDAKRAVAAADALTRLGDDAGRAYLVRVVADTSFVARPQAALALARAGGAEALAFVASGLVAAEPDTRVHAIAVAARLGARAEPHLDAIAALADHDPDPAVRAVAIAALWITS